MTPTAVLRCLRDPGEARPIHLGRALTCGGAEGVRTPDPQRGFEPLTPTLPVCGRRL